MRILNNIIKKLKKTRRLPILFFLFMIATLFLVYGFLEKKMALETIVISLFILAICLIFILQYMYKNQIKYHLKQDNLKMQIKILETAVDKASEIADYKSLYLANINYEIRTPLSTVVGMLNMLKNTHLTDYQNEKLKIAEYASKQLQNLVTMVTDEAEVDINKIKLNTKATHLETELEPLFKVFEYMAMARGIDFEYKFLSDRKKKFLVIADAFRIQQVLFNLINNAIKFTNSGKISVIIDNNVDIDNEQILSFYIKDTGMGMPIDEVKQFLNNNETLNMSILKDYKGGGIGLSVSRQLISLMGGKLKLETKADEGTTLYFTLPLKKALSVKIANTKITPILKAPFHVLVADDDRMSQKVIKFLLEQFGAECTFAKNGLEAIALYKIQDFKMIFMDIYMPHLDGFLATKDIKHTEKYKMNNIPVIGVSASTFKQDVAYAKHCGIDDFLSKPIDVAKLKTLLTTYANNAGNII